MLGLRAGCSAGDKMAFQVQTGNVYEASQVYNDNPAFFARNRADYLDTFRKVAAKLNADFAPGLKAATQRLADARWPAPVADWPALRDAMDFAAGQIETYGEHKLLLETAYTAPEYTALRRLYDPLHRQIEDDAPDRFAVYDHFAPGDRFLDIYPVHLPEFEFLSRNLARIDGALAEAGTTGLKRFLARYPKRRSLSDQAYGNLSDHYLAAVLRESGLKGRPSFAALIEALQTAWDDGFEPTAKSGYRVAVVVLPPESSERFRIDYRVNMPATLLNATPSSALTTGAAAGADYVMAMRRTSSGVARRMVSSRLVGSRYLAGYRTEENPDYRDAELDLRQAESDFNYLSSKLASSPDIAPLARQLHRAEDGRDISRANRLRERIGEIRRLRDEVDSAKREVDYAIDQLRGTPKLIDVPVYRSYEVEYRRLSLSRRLTVKLTVVDRRRKKYFRSDYTATEDKEFRVVYGLHDADTDPGRHLSGAATEAMLGAWESSGFALSARELALYYATKQSAAVALPSQRRIVADLSAK